MDEMILSVFYDIDNFCKELKKYFEHYLIATNGETSSFESLSSISLSEIMTVCVFFHLSGYRTFKWYDTKLIQKEYRKFFPKLVSYNRFVDSTTLDVCNSYRIQQHKVFEGIAQRGRSSTGWFYGFKLHLVIYDRGEILSFCLTPGNVDDRNHKVMVHLTKSLFGKLFAELLEKGVELVTKQKKNAKNLGMLRFTDRLLLRKRVVIETVNDFLKNTCQMEHSRHRSRCNFVVNLVAGLCAHYFLPKKPSIYAGNMAFA